MMFYAWIVLLLTASMAAAGMSGYNWDHKRAMAIVLICSGFTGWAAAFWLMLR
jgi:hypothetical protein